MSEQPGPNEAELIVLRYGEWMRSGTGPGPCTASEVVSQLRAQKPSELDGEKRFHSANEVFRYYGLPICDCKVEHQPECATRKRLAAEDDDE